jgi:hypothetical protein
MIIHALVEGPSEKALLEPWAKRLLSGHVLKAYPHEGKGRLPKGPVDPKRHGLLDQLPAKLRAFGKSLDPTQERVLVLIDADNDNVGELQQDLDELKHSLTPAPVVLFRFAIEELEAFYLADLKALKVAFPNFDNRLAQQYIPDSIRGTWELFGNVIGDGGGNKVAWAQAMAKVLTTRGEESRSPSFKKLCSGLRELVTPPPTPTVKPKKPRRSKTAVPRDPTGKRKW